MNGDDAIDLLLTKWPDASPEVVADALWLAALGVVAPARDRVKEPIKPPSGTGKLPPSISPSESAAKEKEKPPELEKSPPPPKPLPAGGELVLPQIHARAGALPRSFARLGLELRVPGARALPGAAELLRALRPLRRRVESRRQFNLDIDATIHRIAAEGLWLPVMRPTRARWLDLALVIEASRTMVLWRDTLREMRRVLEQAGAFRDVRVWWLDSTASGPVLRVQPGGAPSRPRELIAADGRRVVLLATDCLSPAWSSDEIASLLAQWGARQPVAILQMLPREWWSRTALYREAIVHAGAAQPGMPNRRLQRLAAFGAVSGTPPPGIPIPVLTTEPELVTVWAQLVGSGHPPEIPAVIFRDRPSALPKAAPAKEQAKEEPLAESAADVQARAGAQILGFERLASPLAFQLATLLAAAPLRLPVMRLVQNTLLPQSGQIHLAEVFLGGLVRRVSPPEMKDQELVNYDFQPGVRTLLLDAARADDAVEVQTRVSKYLAERFGQRLDFRGMLKSPEAIGDLPDFQENSEFARVSAEVLRRMGGKYAQVAQRLESGGGPAPAAAKATNQRRRAQPQPAPGFANVPSQPPLIKKNRSPHPRVLIEYDVDVYGAKKKIELPFVLGVMADLSAKAIESLPPVAERKALEIDFDNFNQRLKASRPHVAFQVPNTLTGEGNLYVEMTFQSLEDFSPAVVARKVDALNRLLTARSQLFNLLTLMEGKSGAEQIVGKLLRDPTLLKSLASAPRPETAPASNLYET